jgi:hypothetical protein
MVKRILIVLAVSMIFNAGCSSAFKSSSSVLIHTGTEPNQVVELTGQAAENYAARITEVHAAEQQTAKGRQNEMIAELKKVLPIFTLVMFAGLAFWGFTRSRFGWVVPGAAIGGIIFILAVGRWAEWVTAGVIVIVLGLLVWKAVEYQKERNSAINTSPKANAGISQIATR